MSNSCVIEEIIATEAKFVQNANAKDPVSLVKDYYAEDAVLVPPGSPENVKGQKALLNFWNELIFKERATNITIKTISAEGSGDLAYEIGEFGYTSPDKFGQNARTSGKFVVVYRKEADGYKAIVDIFNVNKPVGSAA